MPYKTLGELRGTLLARLGMGGMGASGGANLALIDSFLQNGQSQLYRLQDWKHLQDFKDVTTGVGQSRYDYPTTGTYNAASTCERDQRILRIETVISGEYVPVHEGITTAMWSSMDTRGQPQRYERYRQIQVYPEADQAYTLRIWYVSDLARFTETSDRASLDDDMILLHALANAKAHYRQPDAQVYQGQLNTLLASLRGQSFSQGGVYRRGEPEPALIKPRVVGRDA